MFGKWKRNFCLRILCVSQNFGPRIFVKKNFVFGKELLSYNWNFVFGKRIFVPEFCVCVSQNFCFFGNRTFLGGLSLHLNHLIG